MDANVRAANDIAVGRSAIYIVLPKPIIAAGK